MIGMYKQTSINVSYPETTIVCTKYNNICTVVSTSTEILSCKHNYSGLANIIPSLSVDMHIGQDLSESLLSGGENGYGKTYASLHDGVFQKADNYRHIVSSIRIPRNKCIYFFEDGFLPDETDGVNYNDLSTSH